MRPIALRPDVEARITGGVNEPIVPRGIRLGHKIARAPPLPRLIGIDIQDLGDGAAHPYRATQAIEQSRPARRLFGRCVQIAKNILIEVRNAPSGRIGMMHRQSTVMPDNNPADRNNCRMDSNICKGPAIGDIDAVFAVTGPSA
jgi:hypothetical protein